MAEETKEQVDQEIKNKVENLTVNGQQVTPEQYEQYTKGLVLLEDRKKNRNKEEFGFVLSTEEEEKAYVDFIKSTAPTTEIGERFRIADKLYKETLSTETQDTPEQTETKQSEDRTKVNQDTRQVEVAPRPTGDGNNIDQRTVNVNKAEELTSAPLGTDQGFADALIARQEAQRTYVPVSK